MLWLDIFVWLHFLVVFTDIYVTECLSHTVQCMSFWFEYTLILTCQFIIDRWCQSQTAWVDGNFEDICQTRFSQESTEASGEPESSSGATPQTPERKGQGGVMEARGQGRSGSGQIRGQGSHIDFCELNLYGIPLAWYLYE